MRGGRRVCALGWSQVGGTRQVTGVVPLTRPYGASTAKPTSSTNTTREPATAQLSPRWLSEVKQRIGHCITFGLSAQQVRQAGSILQEVARDWRELVGGSEGFLTGKYRRSMHRLPVAWGEQDAMVRMNVFQSRTGDMLSLRQAG